jgi:hypothetical protein
VFANGFFVRIDSFVFDYGGFCPIAWKFNWMPVALMVLPCQLFFLSFFTSSNLAIWRTFGFLAGSVCCFIHLSNITQVFYQKKFVVNINALKRTLSKDNVLVLQRN